MHLATSLLVGLLGYGGIRLVEATNLPSFHVTLTPYYHVDDERIVGEVTFDGTVGNNETLVQMPTSLASIPTANYSADGIVAWDLLGPIELSSYDLADGEEDQPTRYWVAQRNTRGPITFNFTARPRIVPATTQLGPLFDIRTNDGGLLGSFWALIPTPPTLDETTYNSTIFWNITSDTKAIWTWGIGAGPHYLNDTLATLVDTFFAVGNVSLYPSGADSDDSKFGIYLLQDTPFDMPNITEFIQEFFVYSSNFWQDDMSKPYRVFFRHNTEHANTDGTGGTALLRSFMYGWYNASVTDSRLTTILAHEMTHNWPSMTVATLAEQSHYNEGNAEYYSLRLLWRSGLFSTSEYLSEMNSRLSDYYTNPTVNLSDEAAMDIAWTTRDAQKIPYGRGMIHLTNIDAEVRDKYNGTERLDSLSLDYLALCADTPANCTLDNWFGIMSAALDQSVVDEWNQVMTGSPLIVPKTGSLGPCFDVIQTESDPVIYQWTAKDGVNISSSECLV